VINAIRAHLAEFGNRRTGWTQRCRPSTIEHEHRRPIKRDEGLDLAILAVRAAERGGQLAGGLAEFAKGGKFGG